MNSDDIGDNLVLGVCLIAIVAYITLRLMGVELGN